MEKEKRKHEPTLQSQYTLKSCPICGHDNLEWGVIDGARYQNKLLYLFNPGKSHTIKALRCLNCDSIAQLQVDRDLYIKRDRYGCLLILLGFGMVLFLIAACSLLAIIARIPN
jgi:hypothetical protein